MNNEPKTIFFSWQSDVPERKAIIRHSLQDAIGNNGQYIYEEATRNSLGAVNILSEAIRKIKAAHLFVADLSIIAQSERRQIPNPNVLFELGFAFSQLGESRIILIAEKGARLPFDIEHNLAVQCDFSSSPQKYLTTQFNDILGRYSDREAMNKDALIQEVNSLIAEIQSYLRETEEDAPPYKIPLPGADKALENKIRIENYEASVAYNQKVSNRLHAKFFKKLQPLTSSLRERGVLEVSNEEHIYWLVEHASGMFMQSVIRELLNAANKLR